MYYLVEDQSQSLRNFYIVGDKIGEGSFGVVRLITKRDTGEEFAVKTINKRNLDQDELNSLSLEIDIISQVDHPNIVKTFEVYDEEDSIHMVMECMTGGELFDRIVEKDHYSEREAADTIKPIVDALKYCHNMGIVHRDLKPENLLYANANIGSIIKISDFGLARFFDDDVMTTACGTPSYVAPEILIGRGYGFEVDYWSIGVITYIMLCGFPPFFEDTNEALFEAIKTGRFDFPSPHWDNISPMAKDLISNCLKVNPSERFRADQILSHEWIAGQNTPRTNMPTVTEKIRAYNTRRRFRKYANAAIASNKFISLLRDSKSHSDL